MFQTPRCMHHIIKTSNKILIYKHNDFKGSSTKWVCLATQAAGDPLPDLAAIIRGGFKDFIHAFHGFFLVVTRFFQN